MGLRTPIGFSEASWTGMLNRHTLEWDAPILDAVSLPVGSLPPLADFDDAVPFSAAWRERFPALATANIFMALGDGAAANVGSVSALLSSPVRAFAAQLCHSASLLPTER